MKTEMILIWVVIFPPSIAYLYLLDPTQRINISEKDFELIGLLKKKNINLLDINKITIISDEGGLMGKTSFHRNSFTFFSTNSKRTVNLYSGLWTKYDFKAITEYVKSNFPNITEITFL